MWLVCLVLPPPPPHTQANGVKLYVFVHSVVGEREREGSLVAQDLARVVLSILDGTCGGWARRVWQRHALQKQARRASSCIIMFQIVRASKVPPPSPYSLVLWLSRVESSILGLVSFPLFLLSSAEGSVWMWAKEELFLAAAAERNLATGKLGTEQHLWKGTGEGIGSRCFCLDSTSDVLCCSPRLPNANE